MKIPRISQIGILAIALVLAIAATTASDAAAEEPVGQFTFGTEWGYVGGDVDESGFIGVQMGAMWTFGMWTEGGSLMARDDTQLFEIGFDLAVDYFFTYVDGGVRGEVWANYYFLKDIDEGAAWPAFGIGMRLGAVGLFASGVSLTALPQLAFRLYFGGVTFMIDVPFGAAFAVGEQPVASNEISFVVAMVLGVGVYF